MFSDILIFILFFKGLFFLGNQGINALVLLT